VAIALDMSSCPRATSGLGEAAGELLRRALGGVGRRAISPVYVNEGLTLDFIDDDEKFRSSTSASASMRWRSTQSLVASRRPDPVPQRAARPGRHEVSAQYGNVYWNEPDGHQWEC